MFFNPLILVVRLGKNVLIFKLTSFRNYSMKQDNIYVLFCFRKTYFILTYLTMLCYLTEIIESNSVFLKSLSLLKWMFLSPTTLLNRHESTKLFGNASPLLIKTNILIHPNSLATPTLLCSLMSYHPPRQKCHAGQASFSLSNLLGSLQPQGFLHVPVPPSGTFSCLCSLFTTLPPNPCTSLPVHRVNPWSLQKSLLQGSCLWPLRLG